MSLFSFALLAGGQAKRLGGQDKGLVQTPHGIPLAQAVIEQLNHNFPEIPVMVLANRNQAIYAQWADGVYADIMPGFLGPMVGILTALKKSQTPWVISWPTDAPFVSKKLIEALMTSIDLKPEYALHTFQDEEGRLQPLFGAYHQNLITNLEAAIAKGHLALTPWVKAQNTRIMPWHGEDFINLNTPEAFKEFNKKDPKNA